MNRAETLKRLDRISEMSDREIAINAARIREVVNKAHMHINVLRRLNGTNKSRNTKFEK